MSGKWLSTVRATRLLTLLFGLILLCTVWIGLFFKLQSERQLELDHAIRETSNYARTFEEHTVRTIQGLDQIALFLKYQAEKEGLALDLPRLVSDQRFVHQPFLHLGIADANGDSVASSLVPFTKVSAKNLEHFLVHKTEDRGTLFISKPVQGLVTGKWSIQLSRRINKPDGSFGGVVFVAVDPNYFVQFYKQVNLGKHSSIALFGRDGILRVRQSEDEIQFGLNFNQRMAERIVTSEVGSFTAAGVADGVTRIYSYRAMRQYPLFVAVGMSEQQAFRNLNQRTIFYYWVCSALSLAVLLFVGLILTGITRQKRTSQALLDAQWKFQALFEQGPIGVAFHEMIYDAAGKATDYRFLDVNDAFIQMTGVNPKGKTVTQAFPGIEADPFDWIGTYGQVVQTGEPLRFEQYFSLLDRWYDCAAYRYKQDQFVVAFINITQRKKAEEALGESEARYRAIVEQAPEAVLLIDPDSGEISEANSRFTERFGYDLRRDAPLTAYDITVDEPENTERIIRIAKTEGILPPSRRTVRHKNGAFVSVERSATLVRYRDRDLISVTLRDISDEVRREQEISRDAERAARVQNALLPKPTASPHLEISTIYQPRGYVGGDLYFLDWRYDNSMLRGFLVDATGHGLGTALHTASLHVLLREVNDLDLPLTDAMRWLNRRASEYFTAGDFAGAVGFEIDLQTRQLRWICAGMPEVWMATKSVCGVVAKAGLFLGLLADESYDLHVLPIEIGDAVYFMTDGLNDQLDHQAELPLKQYPEMVGLLRTLSESTDRQDDATAICIRVRSFAADPLRRDGWPRILSFNGYGDYQRLKGDVAKILAEVTGSAHSLPEVAVNEALANAMECRDGVARQHQAKIRFNKTGTWLTVRVKTSRLGFAGNAVLRRLRSSPEELFAFGEDASMGRGIPLMLSLADKMTYNSEGTEVLLAWRLREPGGGVRSFASFGNPDLL